MTHELRHLFDGVKGSQDVEVIGQDSDGVHRSTRDFLGSGKTASDDGIEPFGRPKQESTFRSSLGDLDRSLWMRKVAYRSSHAMKDDNSLRNLRSFIEFLQSLPSCGSSPLISVSH